ncbi:MAG: geranylgeranyl reductase family protein [Promethearchaeota archaeon]
MEKIQNSYDVIVIGAGTGGTTAARFVAKSGLKVCLIDRKQRDHIGDKICGDAVGSEIFDFLNISHPQNEELSCHIKGAKLYSPNLKKCIVLKDPKQAGYIVNRLEFGQRLLNEALDAGVEQFLDNTMALGLLYKNGEVNGLKVKLTNGETTDIKSNIIIDGSGFYSPLRRNIRSNLVETEILQEDTIICYREIVKFSPNEQEVQDPEYISIILDQEKAPGGYIWYFPKNESSVNIGLGTFMDYSSKIKKLYKKNVFNEFIKTSNFTVISTGGGVVPVRRPLWSCADNRILFIGDAGSHVNPLHGGGIDPSMRGGYHAANSAISAIESGDYSIHKLWDYNYKIMTSFGSEFAALDLLRIVLQSLSNDDLNFGLERDLLTGDEILQISSTGGLDLSLMNMVVKAFKGISRPTLLLDLNYLRIRMKEISTLYNNFPNQIENFSEWKTKVIKIYDKIKRMIVNTKKK